MTSRSRTRPRHGLVAARTGRCVGRGARVRSSARRLRRRRARPRRPASTTAPGVGTVTTVAPDGVQEVTLQTQDDYVFTPDHFTVAPGTVRLTVVNAAKQLTHNFDFTPGRGPAPIERTIPLLAPGEKKTIEFDVTDAGRLPLRVQLPRPARAGRHDDGQRLSRCPSSTSS